MRSGKIAIIKLRYPKDSEVNRDVLESFFSGLIPTIAPEAEHFIFPTDAIGEGRGHRLDLLFPLNETTKFELEKALLRLFGVDFGITFAGELPLSFHCETIIEQVTQKYEARNRMMKELSETLEALPRPRLDGDRDEQYDHVDFDDGLQLLFGFPTQEGSALLSSDDPRITN